MARPKPSKAPPKAPRPETIERFASYWVLSFIAGPFLGWMVLTSTTSLWTLSSWRWRTVVGLAIGVALPLVLAVIATVRAKGPKAPFLVLTTVVCALVFRTAVLRLVHGPTEARIVVTEVACGIHAGRRKASGPCLLYEVLRSGGEPLRAEPVVASSLPRKGLVCVSLLDDVILEGKACPP